MSANEEIIQSEVLAPVSVLEEPLLVIPPPPIVSEVVCNEIVSASANSNTVESIANSIINTLLGEVKGELLKSGVVFGSSTLHLVIKYAMEAVEKRNLKGLGQKHIVVSIINELIKELPHSDEKNLLNGISLSGGISNTIDLIVDATKGKLNVNVVADVAKKSCFMPCLNYLFSKIKKSSKKESVELEQIKA